MSTSDLSPPLVPDLDRAVFMVLDDFGPLGRAGRSRRRAHQLFTVQYRDPVSGDPVQRRRGLVEGRVRRHSSDDPGERTGSEALPDFLRDFVDQRDPGGDAQLPLPLIRRGQSRKPHGAAGATKLLGTERYLRENNLRLQRRCCLMEFRIAPAFAAFSSAIWTSCRRRRSCAMDLFIC
jgi:hypothetical protein